MKVEMPPVVRPEMLEEGLRERADIRLLDVRTPAEYEAAHISGAYNVPLETLGEHARDIRGHVDEPVVLVCQSGSRARQAEDALREAGMPNLHVLDGGMNGWLAAGKPAIHGARRLSLERQVRIVAGGMAALGGVLALLVSPLFALVPLAVGSGLVFAGVTDTCAMAMVLTRLPYNRVVTCDVPAMVRALKEGAPPAGLGRSGPAVPAGGNAGGSSSSGSCAA